MAVYERIRTLREDKDWTQAQMAVNLNVHQTTYSDYELGNLNIPIQVLDKLADLFETSIDFLVGRTDERKPYPPTKVQEEGDAGGAAPGPPPKGPAPWESLRLGER